MLCKHGVAGSNPTTSTRYAEYQSVIEFTHQITHHSGGFGAFFMPGCCVVLWCFSPQNKPGRGQKEIVSIQNCIFCIYYTGGRGPAVQLDSPENLQNQHSSGRARVDPGGPVAGLRPFRPLMRPRVCVLRVNVQMPICFPFPLRYRKGGQPAFASARCVEVSRAHLRRGMSSNILSAMRRARPLLVRT